MNKILKIWIVIFLLVGVHYILIGLVYGPDPRPIDWVLISSKGLSELIFGKNLEGWLYLGQGISRYCDLVLYPFVYWCFLNSKVMGKSIIDSKWYLVLIMSGLVFHESFWILSTFYTIIGYSLTPYQNLEKVKIFFFNTTFLMLVITWTFPGLGIGVTVAIIFLAAVNLGVFIGNLRLSGMGSK